MSRLGKKPIAIPEKTSVTYADDVLKVVGPHGELARTVKPVVSIDVKDSEVLLEPKGGTREARVLWGTYASHLMNMIQGVNEPFVKRLVVEGVGYRVELQGQELVLSVGYSHQVRLPVPEGLIVGVEKNVITVSGIDKEAVGKFAAEIREVKKPEPYKGKGIRYDDEIVRRKQGKRAA